MKWDFAIFLAVLTGKVVLHSVTMSTVSVPEQVSTSVAYQIQLARLTFLDHIYVIASVDFTVRQPFKVLLTQAGGDAGDAGSWLDVGSIVSR